MNGIQKNIVCCYVYEGSCREIAEPDLKKFTHINIAFGTLQDDCTIKTDGLKLINNAEKYKKINPDLKIILSIGSGSPSAFSDTASTDEKRKKVARNCLETVKKYHLDGIDYDWEYPCCPSNRITYRAEDKQNFTALCREIRTALDEIDSTENRHAMFTIAAGADYYYLDFTEMDKVQQYLDYVWLMTYDFRCGFHALTGHHTNLYRTTGDIFRTSAKDAAERFNEAGVPLDKIVLGAAFYSRMCRNVPDINHGLLQYVNSNCGYGPSYTDIKQNYVNKNGFVRYWDDTAKAPYLFDGSTFISYDDPQSIGEKCRYIKQAGLAGIFSWDYGSDRTGDLLDARCTAE